MRLLALDSATTQLAIGLRCGQESTGANHDGDARHGNRLPALAQKLLAEAGMVAGQLDAIGVGVGPGGFAGLRVGMSFAKGLAWALDIPVIAVGSLESVAAAALQRHLDALRVQVLSDARMQGLYRAVYARAEGRPQPLEPPAELPVSELDRLLATLEPQDCLAGDAPGLAERAPPGRWADARGQASTHPEWQQVLALACHGWQAGEAVPAAALTPDYVRNRVALTAAQRAAGARLGSSAGGSGDREVTEAPAPDEDAGRRGGAR